MISGRDAAGGRTGPNGQNVHLGSLRPYSKPDLSIRETTMNQNGPFFAGSQRGGFPKGWFWRMFPRNENRNEGTFAKTTLSRNRPFVPSRILIHFAVHLG